MTLTARDDAGQVAGAEGVLFGVLLFVFGLLLVVRAWAVVDAKLTVTAAAREAARTFVEGTDAADAHARAVRAALEVLSGSERRPGHAVVRRMGGDLRRCARVTYEAAYTIPPVDVPVLGPLGGLTVTARHSEIVDPYRSGLGTLPAMCG